MGFQEISWFWEQHSPQLEKLWSAGKSASEIATELKCSRNAVIGRARRMNLDSRPSPIIRRPQAVYDPFTHIDTGCEWPSGTPGTETYSECGEPRHRHAPYCQEHCIKAVRPRPNGEKPAVYGEWGEGLKVSAK